MYYSSDGALAEIENVPASPGGVGRFPGGHS